MEKKNAFRARLPSKLHRQLIHQHHLQSHLHCGNGPTVANHNGIPSATHPPAPLAIPFTLRERSYSCKSQRNSVDRTCTKNSWHPIYNAEPIRTWSENDPRMIRPHTRPSRNRRTAEVYRRSGTDFVWKNIGFRASAISQKRISCETSSKTPSATPPPAPLAMPAYSEGTILQLQITMEFHRQLIQQHHLQSHLHCGNDPTVANHKGILSTAHARKTVETPFTMRNRSETDPSMIRTYPRMIRPHTRPSRTRRTAEVDHRGSGTDFVWKNIGFRASAISQKRISCETSSKTPSATPPPAPLAMPFTLREGSYSCKSQRNSVDRTCTKNSWNPIYNAEPIRDRSEHDPNISEDDPTTHETVSHPSHRRGRSSRFGDGLCMEKHRVSCICYLSKTHFVRDFLQNSIGNSSTSTTCNAIYSEGTILEF